jgi:hypothetical protein
MKLDDQVHRHFLVILSKQEFFLFKPVCVDAEVAEREKVHNIQQADRFIQTGRHSADKVSSVFLIYNSKEKQNNTKQNKNGNKKD